MFDVIYIDGLGRPESIATALADRSQACALARETAAARGTGRMVADSLTLAREGCCRNTVLVVPASLPKAA